METPTNQDEFLVWLRERIATIEAVLKWVTLQL